MERLESSRPSGAGAVRENLRGCAAEKRKRQAADVPLKNLPPVVVYFADASALNDDAVYGRVYAGASEYRREKTDWLRFRRDKNLSLCAEYLLMCACRDFGLDYREQRLDCGFCGKPYFRDSTVYFNLSHAGEKAMCAMSRYEVGCDVEKIGRPDMDVARQFCAEEELACLSAFPAEEEKKAHFYRLWTLKESYIKCTGEGMSFPMDRISFLSAGGITPYYRDGENRYRFWEGKCGEGYQYALCVKTDGRKETAGGACYGEEESAEPLVRQIEIG